MDLAGVVVDLETNAAAGFNQNTSHVKKPEGSKCPSGFFFFDTFKPALFSWYNLQRNLLHQASANTQSATPAIPYREVPPASMMGILHWLNELRSQRVSRSYEKFILRLAIRPLRFHF